MVVARATQAVVKAVDTQSEDDVEAAIGEVRYSKQRCTKLPPKPTPHTPRCRYGREFLAEGLDRTVLGHLCACRVRGIGVPPPLRTPERPATASDSGRDQSTDALSCQVESLLGEAHAADSCLSFLEALEDALRGLVEGGREWEDEGASARLAVSLSPCRACIEQQVVVPVTGRIEYSPPLPRGASSLPPYRKGDTFVMPGRQRC